MTSWKTNLQTVKPINIVNELSKLQTCVCVCVCCLRPITLNNQGKKIQYKTI